MTSAYYMNCDAQFIKHKNMAVTLNPCHIDKLIDHTWTRTYTQITSGERRR